MNFKQMQRKNVEQEFPCKESSAGKRYVATGSLSHKEAKPQCRHASL